MKITPKALYLDRRRFLQLGAAGAVGLLATRRAVAKGAEHGAKLAAVKPGRRMIVSRWAKAACDTASAFI